MTYLFRYQPFKILYLTYQLCSTVSIRLPLWILTSIPKSLRPRPTWTLGRAIWVPLLKHLFNVSSEVNGFTKTPDYRELVTGVKAAWVDPIPEDLVVAGIKAMSVAAHVQPIRLPGYWLDRKGDDIPIGQRPSDDENVLYHLHGGGYTSLSANPNDPTANIGRGLMEYCESIRRVFSVEYRLSMTAPAANPFPTALIDALTGYYYLVNVVGFSPRNIIIEGDSAGGNLALALTRYLVENQDRADGGMPGPPGALILLSPWADMSSSHKTRDGSWYTHSRSDYLDPASSGEKAEAFTGPFGLSAADTNPYMSPASLHPSLTVSFKGFPPTFLVAGGAEMFRDQIRTLRDRMTRDMGEMLTYFEPPDAVHDFVVFSRHEPERTEALARIGEWLSAQ